MSDSQPSGLQAFLSPSTLRSSFIAGVAFGCHAAAAESATANDGTRADWWMVAITIGLFAVAAIQAGMFYWQLRLMESSTRDAGRAADAAQRSVEVMSKSAERQLRAYLIVEKVDSEVHVDGRYRGTIYIKNSGQTPALNVRCWIHSWIAEWPLVEPLPPRPDDFEMARSVLAAGAELHQSYERTHPVPEKSRPLLRTPEGTLYVYGAVEYMDTFGHTRRTDFRLFRKGGIIQTGPVTGFSHDTHGNTAT